MKLRLKVSEGRIIRILRCVKCKLALHGLAAHLTVCSEAAIQQSTKQTKQRRRLLILILSKITKHNIHLRFTVCSVRHLEKRTLPRRCSELFKRTFQSFYLLPRPTQPSVPPGSVNEYQLRLVRQRQVWFIPIADERGVCR